MTEITVESIASEYEHTLTFSQRLVITAALDGETMTDIAANHNMELVGVRQIWNRIIEKLLDAVDDDHNRLRGFIDLDGRPIFTKYENLTEAYVLGVTKTAEKAGMPEVASHLRKALHHLKRGQEREKQR